MAMRLLDICNYGGSCCVLASPVTLISAISLGCHLLFKKMTLFATDNGFEEDCLLFISRVPYYILINKRGRCT